MEYSNYSTGEHYTLEDYLMSEEYIVDTECDMIDDMLALVLAGQVSA